MRERSRRAENGVVERSRKGERGVGEWSRRGVEGVKEGCNRVGNNTLTLIKGESRYMQRDLRKGTRHTRMHALARVAESEGR